MAILVPFCKGERKTAATSRIVGNTADENEDSDASQTTIYKGLDVSKQAGLLVQAGKDVEIFRESSTTKDIDSPTALLLNEFEENLKTLKSIHTHDTLHLAVFPERMVCRKT